MTGGTSRRGFLQLGAVTPLFNGRTVLGRREQNGRVALSGVVRHLSGDPLQDGEIRIYDQTSELSNQQLLAQKQVKGTQDFKIEFSPTEDMVLIAADPTLEEIKENHRFLVSDLKREHLEQGVTIELNSEVVVPPSISIRENEGSGGDRGGAIALWREIDPVDTTKQTIWIEIVSTADGLDYEGNRAQPWEIVGPSKGEVIDSPLRASFNLIIPEHVFIGYGNGEKVMGKKVDVFESTDKEGIEAISSPPKVKQAISRWHSTKEPQLPVSAVYSSLDIGSEMFVSMSEKDVEEQSNKQQDIEGMVSTAASLISSLTPVPDPTTALEAIQFLFDKDIDAKLGDRYADPATDRPSPNTHDTVTRRWIGDGDTPAILFRVPVEFDEEAMQGESTNFIGDVRWAVKRNAAAGTEKFHITSFGKQFSVGPVETERSGKATVSGRILTAGGDPVSDATLYMFRPNGNSFVTGTHIGEGGEFSYTVPKDLTHTLNFYEINDPTPSDGTIDYQNGLDVMNGVPDIYGLQLVEGTQSQNLGEIRLPEAYNLDVTVVDESGEAVPRAEVLLAHAKNGRPGFSTITNKDGIVRLGNSNGAGMEFAGKVLVIVSPPQNSTGFVDKDYRKEIQMSRDRGVKFQLERA